MKIWLKEHYLGIIFALCIGIITVAPQLIFIKNLGADYKGLYMMKADAEPYYLARIHAVYKGDISVDPYIFEEKYTIPKATLNLIDPIVAWPGIIFHLSVPTLALIYKFLFPAIIALLIYLLGLKIFKNKWWSAVIMVAVMCGYYLLYPTDLASLLKFQMGWNSFSDYSRPTYPELSSIVFFSYLVVLYKALEEKIWKWFIYLGLIFGASFYVYYFDFTFIFALSIVAIVVCWLLKDRKVSQKLAVSNGIGIILGSYFLVNLYKVMQSPVYASFAEIQKMAKSHAPIFSSIGILTFILFLIYYFGKQEFFDEERNSTDHFVLILILTTFAVLNQQVITGRVMQAGHYHWFFNMPVYIITLSYVAWNFLKNKRKELVISLGLLVIGISFWATGFVQYSSYKFWYAQTKEDQRYVSVFDYLNQVSKPDDVVFANMSISPLVPVYTFDNVVWDDGAYSYLIPKGRDLFRPETILKGNFDLNIRKYRVDFVLWDYKKEPDWKMDQRKSLKYLNEAGGIKIYSLIK